jgi:hypothetical protein
LLDEGDSAPVDPLRPTFSSRGGGPVTSTGRGPRWFDGRLPEAPLLWLPSSVVRLTDLPVRSEVVLFRNRSVERDWLPTPSNIK